jgi:hypothetical protein
VHWLKVGLGGPLVRRASQLGWLGGKVSWLHQLWALDTLCTDLRWHIGKAKNLKRWHTWPAGQGGGADRSHFGSVGPGLCATSSPRVIFSVTMPYFGHIENIHGFWNIWCFSIIRCSWNGRSTKLMELVSNKHLSSISWMKCSYVGGKYMHFMTVNTPPLLEFCSSLSKRKELNPMDISKNSSAKTDRE